MMAETLKSQDHAMDSGFVYVTTQCVHNSGLPLLAVGSAIHPPALVPHETHR